MKTSSIYLRKLLHDTNTIVDSELFHNHVCKWKNHNGY